MLQLAALPRVRLAALPTPLDEAPRLAKALAGGGEGPRILIKRDDLTGFALGGNKVRKWGPRCHRAALRSSESATGPSAKNLLPS